MGGGGAIRSCWLYSSRLKNASLSLKSSVPTSYPEEPFVSAFGKAAAAAPPSTSFWLQQQQQQSLSFKLLFRSNFSIATVASPPPTTFTSPGFSSAAALSHVFCSNGSSPMNMLQRSVPYSTTASVAKRIRRSEKMRIKNRARKSKVKARMNKVFEALDELKNKPDIQAEELVHIEKLIQKAHSSINKAVSVGVMHRNTGDRRKARLVRGKNAVEVHHGLRTPTPIVNAS